MKNSKILIILFISGVLRGRLNYKKNNRKSKEQRQLEIKKKHMLIQARKLIIQGRKNYHKLDKKLQKDPRYLKKINRKLSVGGLSEATLLGLLGGVGGLY